MMLLERAVRFLYRFGREKKGVAAVEFAIIAIPFFLLLYAVIDTGLVFFATSTLFISRNVVIKIDNFNVTY